MQAPGTKEDHPVSNLPIQSTTGSSQGCPEGGHKAGPPQAQVLVGEKEKARLLNLMGNLSSKLGSLSNIFQYKPNASGVDQWYCNACSCTIQGWVFEHEVGERHKMMLGMDPEKYVPIPQDLEEPPVIQIAPGEPVPPGFEAEAEKVASIQKRLDALKVPLVALEYLLELKDLDPTKQPTYLCVLCDIRGDHETILTHLTSYKHIQQYLNKHFPTSYGAVSPYNTSQYLLNWQSALQAVAQAIEKKFGRLKPIAVYAKSYEQDRDFYLNLVCKRKHFSEESGCTFEDVVNAQALPKLHGEGQQRPEERPADSKSFSIYTPFHYAQLKKQASYPLSLRQLSEIKPTESQNISTKPTIIPPLCTTPTQLVVTTTSFKTVVDLLVKQPAIGVHCEAKETAVHKICYLAISTINADYIIDAEALRKELHLLTKVFENAAIVKVMYDASETLYYLSERLKLYTVNMFDVSRADLSLLPKSGFKTLNEKLKAFGVSRELPWNHPLDERPISDDVRSYCQMGSHYLLHMYRQLRFEMLQRDKQKYFEFLRECNKACALVHESPSVREWRSGIEVMMAYHRGQRKAIDVLGRWRKLTAVKKNIADFDEVLSPEAMTLLALCLPDAEEFTVDLAGGSQFVKDDISTILRIIELCRSEYCQSLKNLGCSPKEEPKDDEKGAVGEKRQLPDLPHDEAVPKKPKLQTPPQNPQGTVGYFNTAVPVPEQIAGCNYDVSTNSFVPTTPNIFQLMSQIPQQTPEATQIPAKKPKEEVVQAPALICNADIPSNVQTASPQQKQSPQMPQKETEEAQKEVKKLEEEEENVKLDDDEAIESLETQLDLLQKRVLLMKLKKKKAELMKLKMEAAKAEQ